MPNTREKLIELLSKADDYGEYVCKNGCKNCRHYENVDCGYVVQADYLISNGVTIEEDHHWATEQAYKNGYEDGKPKWIPVTERLPDLELLEVKEDDKDVFPCLAARKHPRAKGGKYTAKVWYDGYGFIDGISNDVTDEITHWMPLPEPPKGE